MNKKLKITHLTSAHTRYDTRIFFKMCSSLSTQKNYNVSLVVADGKGYEIKNSVTIFDVGEKTGGRISRMTSTVKKVFVKARELDSDIYHLHDPELMPIGIKLKKLGKKVIFDAHEDLPQQIYTKRYLKVWQQHILSKMVLYYERYTLKKFSGLIGATDYITKKLSKINEKSIGIINYPIISEFEYRVNTFSSKNENICYVGGLADVRGIEELVIALEKTKENVRLKLAGAFSDPIFKNKIESLKGWRKVDFLGFINRKEIADTLNSSIAGVITVHPIPSYLVGTPIKMFEYMASGLPVISSNFEGWKDIIIDGDCGLFVNPLDVDEIAKAIDYLVSNPNEAERLGANGRRLVEEKYNWDIEEEKLFGFYNNL